MLSPPEKSFEQLVTASLPKLTAFAVSLCRDPVRAEDLVQEAVLKACIYREKFEVGTNFDAWIFTILRNHFHSQYRKDKRLVEDVDDAIATGTAVDEVPPTTTPGRNWTGLTR